MAKEVRINVRASEELKTRIQRAVALTKVNETTLVLACIEAALDYIEENGEITLPLVMLPKKQWADSKAASAHGNRGAVATHRGERTPHSPKAKTAAAKQNAA